MPDVYWRTARAIACLLLLLFVALPALPVPPPPPARTRPPRLPAEAISAVLDAHFAAISARGIRPSDFDDGREAFRVQRLGGAWHLVVPPADQLLSATSPWRWPPALVRLANALLALPDGPGEPDADMRFGMGDCDEAAGPVLSLVACGRSNLSVPVAVFRHAVDGAVPRPGEQWRPPALEIPPPPWEERANRAVFRGTPAGRTSFGCGEGGTATDINATLAHLASSSDVAALLAHPSSCGGAAPAAVAITPENFPRIAGRQRLLALALADPSSLDVNLRGFPLIFPSLPNATAPERYRGTPPESMPASRFASYRIALHVEGNCGWADRLRLLLALGTCTVRQLSPCREWYDHFLVPWRDYVPCDGRLDALAPTVRMLRGNPGLAGRIAARGRESIAAAMYGDSVRAYGRGVVQRWVAAQRFAAGRHPRARRVYPGVVGAGGNGPEGRKRVDWGGFFGGEMPPGLGELYDNGGQTT
ncbi:hypothetical protein DFJ74DRAFT_711857 [Hyaloraphidium curvatum]|nr:hypothetical protein DFJ74DRAFT_711857 [Hyaloraphidium curvatum]